MWICPRCAMRVEQNEVRHCPNCKAMRLRTITADPPPDSVDEVPSRVHISPLIVPNEQRIQNSGFQFFFGKGFKVGFLLAASINVVILYLHYEGDGSFLALVRSLLVGTCILGFLGGLAGNVVWWSWHIVRDFFYSDEDYDIDKKSSKAAFNRERHSNNVRQAPDDTIQPNEAPQLSTAALRLRECIIGMEIYSA